MNCSFEGCQKVKHTRGYCATHYNFLMKKGKLPYVYLTGPAYAQKRRKAVIMRLMGFKNREIAGQLNMPTKKIEDLLLYRRVVKYYPVTKLIAIMYEWLSKKYLVTDKQPFYKEYDFKVNGEKTIVVRTVAKRNLYQIHSRRMKVRQVFVVATQEVGQPVFKLLIHPKSDWFHVTKKVFKGLDKRFEFIGYLKEPKPVTFIREEAIR